MATGTVRWFNAERGFGFIRPDEGPDVFAYSTAITDQEQGTLRENQRVEFHVVRGPAGPRADRVRLL
ncbi:cold-shock protein [Longispora sp. K20-0274]|uniref:cold-shock protein n=1 Tax=Longispora sp. K20-0274 TaxID=3088255 RepID=UPI00399B72D7